MYDISETRQWKDDFRCAKYQHGEKASDLILIQNVYMYFT